MKRKKLQPLPPDLVRRGDIRGQDPIMTDPLGSYTGRTPEPLETPVQDADDL